MCFGRTVGRAAGASRKLTRTIVDEHILKLWDDEELVYMAQRRLSLTVLTNHFPVAAARLFVDAIESQSLEQFLLDVEQTALRYYRAYLDIQASRFPNSAIGNVSAVMSLKRTIQKDAELTDNWKLSLIDEMGNPLSMRDTLANLYLKAKEQSSSEDLLTQSEDSND